MKFSYGLCLVIALVLASGGPLFAQAPDDDGAVWLVVEEQWEAAQDGDQKWIERLLAADFVGWPNDAPAPRDKGSTRMWNSFQDKRWDGMAHELYLLNIVVHGDTAIAHYLFTNAGKNSEGEIEVHNGRYTDVLVRIDGEWKFLAWHGGDDD